MKIPETKEQHQIESNLRNFERLSLQVDKVYLLVNNRKAAIAGNGPTETKDDSAALESNQRYVLKQTTQSLP